jgi:maleate cis-trans isomerase
MALIDVTAAAEQRMRDEEAVPAARRVAPRRPDVVVFGCASASTLHDPAYDDAVRAGLADAAGAPVVGVMPAVPLSSPRIPATSRCSRPTWTS